MKTSSGFECEIDKNAVNNMELIDAFADLTNDSEDIGAASRVINLLLGKETKKRLYDHVRESDGRVPIDKVLAEMSEIFTQAGDELKKS